MIEPRVSDEQLDAYFESVTVARTTDRFALDLLDARVEARQLRLQRDYARAELAELRAAVDLRNALFQIPWNTLT